MRPLCMECYTHLGAAAANCHPVRDVETVHGPLDILDHAAPRLGAGMKIGFDCTKKIPGEDLHGIPIAVPPRSAALGGPRCSSPDSPVSLAPILNIDRVLSATLAGDDGWLIVRVRKTAAGDGIATIERIAG